MACTSVMAPPATLWEALTDYDSLGKFIPSLVENRCLERRERGAVLYQVGAQVRGAGLRGHVKGQVEGRVGGPRERGAVLYQVAAQVMGHEGWSGRRGRLEGAGSSAIVAKMGEVQAGVADLTAG